MTKRALNPNHSRYEFSPSTWSDGPVMETRVTGSSFKIIFPSLISKPVQPNTHRMATIWSRGISPALPRAEHEQFLCAGVPAACSVEHVTGSLTKSDLMTARLMANWMLRGADLPPQRVNKDPARFQLCMWGLQWPHLLGTEGVRVDSNKREHSMPALTPILFITTPCCVYVSCKCTDMSHPPNNRKTYKTITGSEILEATLKKMSLRVKLRCTEALRGSCWNKS